MINEDMIIKAIEIANSFKPRIEKLEKRYGAEIDELRRQIEKMKCCENCRHNNEGDCQSEHTYDCKYWDRRNKEDFWELKIIIE